MSHLHVPTFPPSQSLLLLPLSAGFQLFLADHFSMFFSLGPFELSCPSVTVTTIFYGHWQHECAFDSLRLKRWMVWLKAASFSSLAVNGRQKSTSPRTRMQWRRRRRPPPPPPEAMSNCRTLQLLLPYIAIITTTIFMSYSIVRIPHPYIQHAPCILPATFPASNCLLRDSDTWRCLWRIVEGKLENGNEVAHGKIENVIQTQTNGQRKCFSFQNAGLVPKRRHRPTASTIALLSSTRLSAGQHYEQ